MTYIQAIVSFFNHPFFVVAGAATTISLMAGCLYTLYLVWVGIFPIWYRLGMALSKRNIAIFADNKFNELKDILIDSGMFREKNIIKIDKSSLTKAEDISFFLIHYSNCKNEIDSILSLKKDSDALIVYCPQVEDPIDKDTLDKLNSHRNTTIVNFRGRLLNDILVSMITTGVSK